MVLDMKRIIQLGLGVAVGMIVYYFVQKAMNKSRNGNGTAGAFGSVRAGTKTLSCPVSADPSKCKDVCINDYNGEWNGNNGTCVAPAGTIVTYPFTGSIFRR
jgi:hypothetical protein